MDDLGAKLKQTRKNKKMSLRKLGEIAHLSHSFIADIESGRSNPSLDTLDALAKALEVSVQDLIGKSSNQPVTDNGSIVSPRSINGDSMSNLPPEALKEIEDFHAYIRYKYKNRNKKQSKKSKPDGE